MAIIAHCPIDDFWYGDPQLFWIYVDTYRTQKEDEIKEWQRRTNMSAWLNGKYFTMAIAHCFSKDDQYPQEPFHIFESDGAKPYDEQLQERKVAEARKNAELISAQIIQVQSYFQKQKSTNIGPKELHREP